MARGKPTGDKRAEVAGFLAFRETRRVRALLDFHEHCVWAAKVYAGADFASISKLAGSCALTTRRIKQMALVGDHISRAEMEQLTKHPLTQTQIVRLATRGKQARAKLLESMIATRPGIAKAKSTTRDEREEARGVEGEADLPACGPADACPVTSA
jgi:hypothetical protein